MGYCTTYRLSMKNKEGWISAEDAIFKEIEKEFYSIVNGDGCIKFGEDFFELVCNEYYPEIKWYDHEHDMVALAKKFPNVRFILEGEGEDREDFWEKIWLGDKFQCKMGKIIYPQDTPDEF